MATRTRVVREGWGNPDAVDCGRPRGVGRGTSAGVGFVREEGGKLIRLGGLIGFGMTGNRKVWRRRGDRRTETGRVPDGTVDDEDRRALTISDRHDDLTGGGGGNGKEMEIGDGGDGERG